MSPSIAPVSTTPSAGRPRVPKAERWDLLSQRLPSSTVELAAAYATQPAVATIKTPIVTLKDEHGKYYGYLAVGSADRGQHLVLFNVLGQPVGFIKDRDILECWNRDDKLRYVPNSMQFIIYDITQPALAIGWLSQDILGNLGTLRLEDTKTGTQQRKTFFRSQNTLPHFDCLQIDSPTTVGPTTGDYFAYSVDAQGNIVTLKR